MSNPIFNLMNNNNMMNNDMMNFINQFNNFRSIFNGNPQEQVQNLLRNGQMTQEQFNQFSQMADQLRSLVR